jgi:hypothetical protein
MVGCGVAAVASVCPGSLTRPWFLKVSPKRGGGFFLLKAVTSAPNDLASNGCLRDRRQE